MSESAVVHSTLVIERTFDALPPRVFAAFSEPGTKQRWFSGPDGWLTREFVSDFRIGGREINRVQAPDGPEHTLESIYHDIVLNERIIFSFSAYLDDGLISVSLATVELDPTGTGTRLTYTEQVAFMNGFDDLVGREQGTRDLFEKLVPILADPSALR
jgi:uncharacterized protein YndB with AHSA1/START domain